LGPNLFPDPFLKGGCWLSESSLPGDDITFTYNQQGQGTVTMTLRAANKINSHDALGVWKADNHAWKVYATTNQYQALHNDYQCAEEAAGLLMGDPLQRFYPNHREVDGWHQLSEEGHSIQYRVKKRRDIACNDIDRLSEVHLRIHCTMTKDGFDTKNYHRTKRGCDAANVVS